MAENDIEDQDDDTKYHLAAERDRMNSSQALLPRALVEDAVGLATFNDWATREGLCLVIKAPSADWVAPVERFVRSLGDWDTCQSRTATSRAPDDINVRQAVSALSLGERVLGVSQDPDRLLPAAMVAAADQTIVLPNATARVVSAVIKAVTGEEPKGLTAAMLAGLSFGELASCIRRNSTAEQAVNRLTAASSKKAGLDTAVGTAPHIQDLHGYGTAKSWALDVVADIEAWRRGDLAFDQIDRHVVLEGAPGLGKTQFARSLARSTGLPLVATSMSDWFAKGTGYLDSVIKQIDTVFGTARSLAPAILFIDELDAIPDRATLGPRNREWWTPVVAHILMTLDGATSGSTSDLVIVGATNYIGRVDDALLRPGRLTRVIHVGHPNATDIVGILRHHLGTDLADADLSPAAQLGSGATGADVMQWVKDARRHARRERRDIALDDLLAVIAPRTTRPQDVEERIATHEAGHAVIGHLMGSRVESISLRRRGSAEAYVQFTTDHRISTRGEVERLVVQLLSGRAAEEALLGSPGLGAGGSSESDLALATHEVGRLHLSIGLGDTLIYRADPGGVAAALDRHPALAASVEAELQRHYATAMRLVRENEALIRSVSDAARTNGHLTGSSFEQLVDGSKI